MKNVVSGFFILILFLNAAFAVAQAGSSVIPAGAVSVARAYTQDQTRLAYLEFYFDHPTANEVRAEYHSKDGTIIASKSLTFSNGEDTPLFEMLDYRRSIGYRVVPGQNQVHVYTLQLHKNKQQTVSQVNTVVTSKKPVVVDAGFHRFLLKHWDQLEQDKHIQFDFLQVDRARLIPMVVMKYRCADEGRFCVRITLDKFLIKHLVPSLYLSYSRETKNLRSYSGPGPLQTARGNSMMVDLEYQYLD